MIPQDILGYADVALVIRQWKLAELLVARAAAEPDNRIREWCEAALAVTAGYTGRND